VKQTVVHAPALRTLLLLLAASDDVELQLRSLGDLERLLTPAVRSARPAVLPHTVLTLCSAQASMAALSRGHWVDWLCGFQQQVPRDSRVATRARGLARRMWAHTLLLRAPKALRRLRKLAARPDMQIEVPRWMSSPAVRFGLTSGCKHTDTSTGAGPSHGHTGACGEHSG
jgi:hypothetical protein